VKLGLILPVVQATARFDPPEWEKQAGPEPLTAIARRADEWDYDFVACPEHVAIPSDIASWRGGTYFDPLATLSFLAASTHRVRLLTHTIVLGYHHPLAVVKSYGTLDWLSRGRLVLGVGVGSLQAEFDMLGVPFIDRGRRADDALGAIRASMGVTEPEYDGTYYSFRGFVVEPRAVQQPPPIWVGGRTLRSLRRAVEFGDGWVPFGLDLGRLTELISSAPARRLLEVADRPIELVLAPEPPMDPIGDQDATLRTIEAYEEVGATAISARFVHRSLEHYLDQMATLAALVH